MSYTRTRMSHVTQSRHHTTPCVQWRIALTTLAAPIIESGEIRVFVHEPQQCERWGAGVETQKNVRGEIGGWGRVPLMKPTPRR